MFGSSVADIGFLITGVAVLLGLILMLWEEEYKHRIKNYIRRRKEK